ncbi:hypothetical protein [Citricoccus sp. CH26A]|uniref:hypothetical protein n=1 Tax=Citricoccus TaxID=169133 RepID=UPI001145DB9E|nr:hypothetical protein [Citricoccus sp. CH26A]
MSMVMGPVWQQHRILPPPAKAPLAGSNLDEGWHRRLGANGIDHGGDLVEWNDHKWAPPTPAQARLLAELAVVADGYAAVLSQQFTGCTTRPKDYCQECFEVSVATQAPPLPPEAVNPLVFETSTSDPAQFWPLVMLWHEAGHIDDVEISGLEEHPPIASLSITSLLREKAD